MSELTGRRRYRVLQYSGQQFVVLQLEELEVRDKYISSYQFGVDKIYSWRDAKTEDLTEHIIIEE
jgi:hypothetical protein